MAKDTVSLEDFSGKNVLFGKIKRATIPRGSVSEIILPDLPRDCHVVTADDIPGVNRISVYSEEMPLLCGDKVSYLGEPLLLVCGPEEAAVNRICGEIRINYDTDYSLLGFENFLEEQVAGTREFSRGSVDSRLKNPHQLVEGEYTTAEQTLPSTFPTGAAARYRNGKIEATVTTQWPYHVQKSISEICDIPRKNITINTEPYFYTYDERLIFPSVHAAMASLLTLKSGKTVKLLEEPADICRYGLVRPPVLIRRTTALNKSGKISAESIDILVDMGAYPLFTDEILSQLVIGAATGYAVPSMKIKATAVRTSSSPMNVFKGCGIGSGTFSRETHISRISGLLENNPADFRLQFLKEKNYKLSTGGILKQDIPGPILARAAEVSDFRRKYAAYEVVSKKNRGSSILHGSLRGIGIALAFSGNGFVKKQETRETYSVKVKLDTDNRLYIKSNSGSSVSGKIWKMTAGQILGIDQEMIEITREDSALLPHSGPSFLSAEISIMTSLVEKCCLGIKKNLFQEPLPLEEKRTYKFPSKNIWDPDKLKGTPFNSLSWGAAVVELELDRIFLRPVIRGIWTVFDTGRLFDRDKARASAETEIYKSLVRVAGSHEIFRSSAPHIEQKTAGRDRVPEVYIEFNEDSRRSSGGISQVPDTVIPSAYVQALSQATGIYLDSIPVAPENIYKYLESL